MMLTEETEFIPLIVQEDEDTFIREEIPDQLCILPIRDIVLFPGVGTTISAGRNMSLHLLQDSYNSNNKIIGVLTQKDFRVENPTEKDLYTIGTVAKILRLLRMPDGSITVIIQGKCRFKVNRVIQYKPYIKVEYIILNENIPTDKDEEYNALIEAIKDLSIKVVQENPNLPSEIGFALKNIENNYFLVNFISTNMNLSIKDKQSLLEHNNMKNRAMEAFRFLTIEYQQIRIKNDIQYRVRNNIDQQQREFFLHQQIKVLQEELGEISAEKEIENIREMGEKKNWTKEAKEKFERELVKIQRTSPHLPEYPSLINYLEIMLDLPWKIYSKDNLDLKHAKKILDRDHYGLEKVKERIIEYLSVLKLKGDMRSPILCFYGPPGVGKTSLGRSIAYAINRKYVRISLGGIYDESEIRGHRRTYVGAMPGRLIQGMIKSGTSNPVFILDEIDKISIGLHGDASAALLEVLDPEQNVHFYDNYLDISYDLSKVMFIATSNSISSIKPALLDRMEILEINGYTVEEKIQIVKKHILPKQLEKNGLNQGDLKVNSKNLEKIILGYTSESGIRSIEKKISKLTRYSARQKAMNKKYVKRLNFDKIEEILGTPYPFLNYEGNNIPGVVIGLAWTPYGGDILYIESILAKGNGKLNLTGNLGWVMKESAYIAFQYVKAYNEYFGIDPEMFETYNVHLHVPSGSVPKDGPSAGVAILCSLVSVYTGKKVKAHLAMTGEITLRGKVLAVGGIPEKILAANRAEIHEIILPKENKKSVDNIKSKEVLGIFLNYVSNMKEVIELALEK